MDVETFYDGILAAIIVGEGEVALVGAPIGLLAESQDEITEAKAATSFSHSAPSAPPSPLPSPPPAPAASVALEDCGDTVREEACEAAQD
ncbi:hypothetical protein LOK49_Contig136G00005 [Camellia lanceoleosa]|nr:hypothetical protein LOK49_Contig136G00005 [Camellia lanceoleosa]